METGYLKKILPPAAATLAGPMAILVFILILYFFAGNFAYATIDGQMSKLKESKDAEAALSKKLESLKNISYLSDNYSNVLVIALPVKNPALFFISQIKKIGADKSLAIKSIKVVAGSDNTFGNVSSVGVSFSLSGNVQNIVDFLTTVRDYAPISSVNGISIGSSDEIGLTKLTFDVYYSPLPTQILSYKESEAKLTDSENEVLKTAASLVAPTLANITPQEPRERVNPF
jgi:Tfp pilus assembly protein PilO